MYVENATQSDFHTSKESWNEDRSDQVKLKRRERTCTNVFTPIKQWVESDELLFVLWHDMFWHKNLIVDTTVTAETVTANNPSNQIPAFVWLCLCCINETYMLNKTPDLETQHSAVVEHDTVVKDIQKEKDTKYVRRAHMYLWWLVNDVICEFPFFVISSSLLHFIALDFPEIFPHLLFKSIHTAKEEESFEVHVIKYLRNDCLCNFYIG